jgi:hypothetical protein
MISRPSPSDDEFYIGYENRLPPRIGRHIRAAVTVLVCAAGAVVATVLVASNELPPSRFEFGVTTELSGVLRRTPYPVLETRGGRVWLVGTGKWAADAALTGIPDGPVILRGSRIRRGRHQMLEVHAAMAAATVTLRGEIVDSKCFLGVMNPGEGAVHRDCARRCVSGGTPPMLLVRDGTGLEELVVLLSADGRTIAREAATIAGRPIAVTGQLVRDGSDYVLYASTWD